jgi:hypothetical protein
MSVRDKQSQTLVKVVRTICFCNRKNILELNFDLHRGGWSFLKEEFKELGAGMGSRGSAVREEENHMGKSSIPWRCRN